LALSQLVDQVVEEEEDGIEVLTWLLDAENIQNSYLANAAGATELSAEELLFKVSEIRSAALRGLGQIASPLSAQAIMDSAYVNGHSIEGDEADAEAILTYRLEAVGTLGMLTYATEEERTAAINNFIIIADDTEVAVRSTLAGSIATAHLHEAHGLLNELANDEVAAVRAASLNAMAAIGSYYRAEKITNLAAEDEETAALNQGRFDLLVLETVKQCITSLDETEPSVRMAAVAALDVFDDKSSVEPLFGHLNDANEAVRSLAVAALSDFDDPATDDVVVENATALLKGNNPQERMMAALLLGRMRRGGEALSAALLTEELWFVKLQLINALANTDSAAYLSEVLDYLDDSDTDVQIAAIAAVGRLGSESEIPRLMKLGIDSPNLSTPVIYALSRLADEKLLTGYLGDDSEDETRLLALRAMGMLADPEAAPPAELVALLDASEIEIISAALNNLRGYKVDEVSDALAKLVSRDVTEFKNYNEAEGDIELMEPALTSIFGVRVAAASLLASLDNRDGINYFLNQLESDSLGEEVIAIGALGQIGHARGVMPVVDKLNSKAPQARWAAAEILRQFADERTSGFLRKRLNDSDIWTQVSALNALTAIGDKNAVSGVRELLATDIPPVAQMAAIDVIVELGDDSDIELIASFLDNDDAGVRFKAASTLVGFGDERGMAFLSLALDSEEEIVLPNGLPTASPLEFGIRLYAAELTGVDAQSILDENGSADDTGVVSWSYATELLLGELSGSTAYTLLSEKTLAHDYLRNGLLAQVSVLKGSAFKAFSPFLDSDEAQLRALGIEMMKLLGDARAVEALVAHLDTRPAEAPVVIATLETLGAEAQLRELFRVGTERQRVLVAEQIARRTDKRMPLVWGQIATEDPSMAVRWTVLEALAADGTGVGQVYLNNILADENANSSLISAVKAALAGQPLPASPLQVVEATEVEEAEETSGEEAPAEETEVAEEPAEA
ncbi:HEAT repeat domain-containing protein, partial [bacterium]|nr:HEAT repeat domain-containing protein [bacterium]